MFLYTNFYFVILFGFLNIAVNCNNVYSNSESVDSLVISTTKSYGNNNTESPIIHLKENMHHFQAMKKRCFKQYTSECFKLDLVSFIDKLGRNSEFQLLPDVTIVTDKRSIMNQRSSQSNEIINWIKLNNDSQHLDKLLRDRIQTYVKSLSLNIKLYRGKSSKEGKSMNNGFLDNVVRSFTDVDKKTGGGHGGGGKYSGALTTAAVLAGGAILWLGVSTIAGIASKALAAALLSIVISCFTAYKTSGGSHHKSTTYEIVSRPVYPSHGHAHSADLQQDAHASVPSPYAYGRNIEWDKNNNQEEIIKLPIREDMQDIIYKAHVRPIYKRHI